MQLQKSNIKPLSQFIKDELAKQGIDIIVGNKVIDRDGDIFEIDKIYTEKRKNYHDEDGNKLKKPVEYKVVMVSYGYWLTDEKTGKKVFRRYGCDTLEKFKERYIKLHKSVEELTAEALDSLTKEEEIDQSAQAINDETALMHSGSKQTLIMLKNEMDKKRELVEIKMRMLERIMELKRRELEVIREEFQKKVETLTKVLYTIELYLGINEEVHLLQDGDRAPSTAPICFRQEILFMDEEVGDPEDGGLDFKNIDDFDKWLIKNKNYNRIIPELKGVVILRVRRKRKEYFNPFLNHIWNQENMMTYILIRNGDRICRIWANIQIHPRLFPLKNEFQGYLDIINDVLPKDDPDKHYFSSDKEKAEKIMFRYKQQMIMLQGLIDRTELFQPLPAPEVKISSQEALDNNWIQWIYDDELKLPDGRLPFSEWQKKINKTITVGSRVIISGSYDREYSSIKDYHDRYIIHTTTHKLPPNGIYTVEKFVREEKVTVKKWVDKTQYKKEYENKGYGSWEDVWKNDYSNWTYDRENKKLLMDVFDKNRRKVYEVKPIEYLIIKYNPKDTLYGSWGEYDPHERKNRISFIIYPEDDNFILNFDEPRLEDVEFYLNDRLDRKSYLFMMPCLYEIKKARIAEREKEKDFVSMIIGQLLKQSAEKQISEERLEKMIWESVDWWKLKNKWKRAINRDDAKALRMIKKRIINWINK